MQRVGDMADAGVRQAARGVALPPYLPASSEQTTTTLRNRGRRATRATHRRRRRWRCYVRHTRRDAVGLLGESAGDRNNLAYILNGDNLRIITCCWLALCLTCSCIRTAMGGRGRGYWRRRRRRYTTLPAPARCPDPASGVHVCVCSLAYAHS